MEGLSADFEDLLDALAEEGATYLVVGAHAVGVHGVPRSTGDLDLWVGTERDNAGRVWRALRAFGAPVRAHGLTVEDLTRPGTVYQVGLPPFRIDILTTISGCTFEAAWARRVVRGVGGRDLTFLGLADLVTNKRASGRTKDLLDLELLREAGVDLDS